MSTNILLCYASWNNDSDPMALDGVTLVDLANFGNAQDAPRSGGRPITDRACIIDWEPPVPNLNKWTMLLRRAKAGDIAYGIDPGVNSYRYDKPVGLISKVLEPYGISMSYDMYTYAKEPVEYYQSRVAYRRTRLQQIQLITGLKSVQLVSPLDQMVPHPYTEPSVLDDKHLKAMAQALDPKMKTCIFVGAGNTHARLIVDAAVRDFATILAQYV